MACIEITTTNFEIEVLQSDKPVLLDFWASWCGPCKRMGPLVEKLAEKHPELKVGKLDTDKAPELAQQYQISAIPALLLFKNGKLVDQSVGLIPFEDIEKFAAQK